MIPDSNLEDVAEATAAAKNAFPKWSVMSLSERSEILLRLSKGIEDRMDEFVAAESLDNGKPVSLARQVDIPRAVSNLSFFRNSYSSLCFGITLYGGRWNQLYDT